MENDFKDKEYSDSEYKNNDEINKNNPILNEQYNNLVNKQPEKITLMHNYYSKSGKDELHPISEKVFPRLCNNIHTILSELYNDVFNLNINYTKSFSNSSKNSNYLIWNEDLPLITYGVNIVDSPHFYLFFKQLVQINQHLENPKLNESDSNFYTSGCELERIIFSDLHLYLVIYSSLIRESSFRYKIRTLFRFLFQPVASVATYFKNKKFVSEFKRVYSMENLGSIYDLILAINSKMEDFLLNAGGRSYCENLSSRNINSFDLAIYAAFKVQQGVIREYKFDLVELLVNQIDQLKGEEIENGMKKTRNFNLISGNDKIVPKNIPEQSLVFRQYDTYRNKDTEVNPIYKRIFGIATFFGIILYLKIKKQ